ncbi:MAG: MAPEG family protein [Rhizobiales bacterium]|nr:MAPEG family protein [Hyphomicrobiales bacterium]MDQ3558436.1 MAPEG family protein [Pseudomonadota bacterium]
MNRAFLVPFVLHFGLIAAIYAWLLLARSAAVKRGDSTVGDFHHASGDPPSAAPIARNLSNQFELPTVAWFCAAVLVALGAVGMADVVAAWAFFVGRVLHTAVQTLTANVPLRALVFTINALGVFWLAGHLAWLVLAGTI